MWFSALSSGFLTFPSEVENPSSSHPPVFIRGSMCLMLISFPSLAPNCGVLVGSIAFFHFDLPLLVQVGSVSASIKFQDPYEFPSYVRKEAPPWDFLR